MICFSNAVAKYYYLYIIINNKTLKAVNLICNNLKTW